MAMPIDNRTTLHEPVIGVPKPTFGLIKDPQTGRIVKVISPQGRVRDVSPIHQISNTHPKKHLTRSGSFTRKSKSTFLLRRTKSTHTQSQPVSTSNLPSVKVTAGNGSSSPLSGGQSLEGNTGKEYRKPETLPIHYRQHSQKITSTYVSASASASASATPLSGSEEVFEGEALRRQLASLAVEQQRSSSRLLTLGAGSNAVKKHMSLSHLSQKNENLSLAGLEDSRASSTSQSAAASGASTPKSQISSGSLMDSGSLSPAYPQVRSPAAAQKLPTFDLSNSHSPISYALENQWGIEPQTLSAQEKVNIQNHCSRLLQISDVTPENNYDMSLLMQTYLAAYQTPLSELFPNICEHMGVEPPIKVRDVSDFLRDNEDVSILENNYAEQIEKLLYEVEGILEDGLVDEEIINSMSYSSRIEHISRVRQTTIKLLKDLGSEHESIYGSLQKDLKNLDIQLQANITALEVLQANDFRNKKNWDYSIAIMEDIALHYFEQRCTKEELEKHRISLDYWRKDHAYPVKGFPRFIAELDKLATDFKNTFNIDKDDFDKCRVKVLEKQRAQISSKEFYYFFGNQFHLMKISHQPSGCLTLGSGEENHDVLGLDGVTVPCCARGASRAVNMNVTRVTADDTEVMKEVRCGVPYAFAIKDGERRKQVTHDRFLDMLTACGLTFFEEQMLDHFYAADKTPKGEFELPIFYNCLLSPDILRKVASYIPFLSLESENLWCYKMSKRINEFNDRVATLPLRLKDGTQGSVKVKPNIFFFVNPCNQLSHGRRLSAFSGTWAAADSYNEEAFRRLFGELNPDKPITAKCYVQQFFDNNPNLSCEIKQELEELHQLLRYILYNKLHHARSDMPFILSNCISELGRIMNMAVVSGCKSAKDRTGNYERCNIEMAMQLHLSRKNLLVKLQEATAGGSPLPDKILPPWDRWMTAHDFYNIAGLLVCSGQMEIAMKNLGIPGFKTPDYMLGGVKGVNPTVTAFVES
ncbi:inositol phosphate phosphatase SopB [Parendozoicomonas sp. Alg238-R29]|uniref:inositol phosphate phosphatase SopB n=1 Tax=Parendozoicomonas sp. Alg238-R29 TaxID=2993446 RepID=UPI00248E214F|nr:inositol phosphate phosphatase SopB [Parendozoicomonas sp. Alg238-R29]